MMKSLRRKSQAKEEKSKTIEGVKFTLVAREAKNVFLAGDFNGWDLNHYPLKKGTKGKWTININLIPGRYEYRFLVDGKWQNDSNCTEFTANPFGSENCVLMLK